ncbi:MAG: cupin domain-containing protein [Acidimicrobiales bacterium]
MANAEPARLVTPADRVEADPTPGMVREEAIAAGGIWAGLVRTAPGMVSGWHHHGEHETSIYVASGRLRLESGVGGTEVVEACEGDFVHVPAGSVHREANPDGAESRLIVVRAGQGPTTVNVDGPA